MSKSTRIKRQTYATPSRTPYGSRLPGSGRMIHVSTTYRWLPVDRKYPLGPVIFVKVAPGETYRKSA